jgi:hypothetical protein
MTCRFELSNAADIFIISAAQAEKPVHAISLTF